MIIYLDGVTGGLVIQTIIALGVTVPIILRSQIARVVARVRGRRSGSTPGGSEPPLA